MSIWKTEFTVKQGLHAVVTQESKSMAGLRQFLSSTVGKATALAIIVIGIVVALWLNWNSSGAAVVSAANDRIFIDAKTGKQFHMQLREGLEIPVKAPSGEKTGYPAELCYWTKDGKPKTEPTAVLLNSLLGKDGPTFCPDCQRLVVGHNPMATADRRPPPTEAEYRAKRGTTAAPGAPKPGDRDR